MRSRAKRRTSTKTAPATSSFKVKPRPVSDIKYSGSYLLYGRSGTGKTTLLSTFPKPILLLDIRDEGTESVEDVEDMDVLQPNEWDDFETIYWWLKQQKQGYRTLGIDTTGQLQQLAMEKVLSEARKSVENAGEWGSMTKQQWGEVASLMKLWITALRGLGLIVVFTAHDRIFNIDEDAPALDDDSIQPEIGPRLMPSVASHLNASVSFIGNTFIRNRVIKVKTKRGIQEKEKTEFCLRVGPNPVYVTKVRKPRSVELPDVLVDPVYEDLVKLQRG